MAKFPSLAGPGRARLVEGPLSWKLPEAKEMALTLTLHSRIPGVNHFFLQQAFIMLLCVRHCANFGDAMVNKADIVSALLVAPP